MVMRYRTLSAAGDYTFGQGSANFLVDSPDAVGQAIRTRLALFTGEWFLDNTEGTPYSTEILGNLYGQSVYDVAIRTRIAGTPNVTDIVAYFSSLENRRLTVNATVDTAFGQIKVLVTL